MSNIVTIDFHGDRLLGIENDVGAFVYLKPIVEKLGLDWSGQYRRVKRDPTLSEGVAIMAIPPEFGAGNDAVFLRLDLLHGWLFTLDSARVKGELRPKVIVYQRECYAALAKAFARPATQPAEPVVAPIDTTPTDLALRMVSEARRSFDALSGRQLWFKLGLPIVPAMRAAPFQASLFSYQRGEG